MLNYCLKNGHYFDKLKVARATRINKRGSRNEMKHYQPISILTSINKIFETILKRRLLSSWNKFNIFSPTQFGFRGNYSTTLEIAQLHEYVLDELDNNNQNPECYLHGLGKSLRFCKSQNFFIQA